MRARRPVLALALAVLAGPCAVAASAAEVTPATPQVQGTVPVPHPTDTLSLPTPTRTAPPTTTRTTATPTRTASPRRTTTNPAPTTTARKPAPRTPNPKATSPSPTTPTKTPTKTPTTTPPADPPAAPEIPQDTTATAKTGTRPWGIDTAVWQHPHGAPITWTRVAAAPPRGASFVFVKVSEGLSSTSNPHAATDREAAAKAGLFVGAYHYASPSRPVRDSAVAQARFAVHASGGKATPGTLPLALDLESNPNDLTPDEMADWALTFLAEARALSGRTPLLYTYPVFFTQHVTARPEFATYPLWIANYGLELNSPTVPAPWRTWTFWQFSAKGAVPGITGAVDLNTFAGSAAELSLLAGRVPTLAGTGKGAASGVPVTAPLMGEALLDGLLSSAVR